MTRIRLFFSRSEVMETKEFLEQQKRKAKQPADSRSGPVFYAATAKKPNRDEAFHLE